MATKASLGHHHLSSYTAGKSAYISYTDFFLHVKLSSIAQRPDSIEVYTLPQTYTRHYGAYSDISLSYERSSGTSSCHMKLANVLQWHLY
eukprot:5730-Heterococcus_DN1.PRE.1